MRKSTIGMLIAGVILIAAGIWLNQRQSAKNDQSAYIERNLSSDQERIYNDRITKTEDVIRSVNPQQNGADMELANLHLQLGNQYFGLGQLDKAEDEYKKALASYEKNEQIYVALSLVQLERKDYLAARLSLEKAVELAPGNTDIWLRFIGLVKDRFPENRQEVDDYYEKALTATGRHTDILVSFAQYQESAGKIEASRALWKEAADSTGNSVYMEEYKRLGGK
jgi:Tfp pilus assembly protein PilF